MSNSRPRINPRHRTLDFERLAGSLLDLAALIDGDEEEIELGAQIESQVTAPAEKSA